MVSKFYSISVRPQSNLYPNPMYIPILAPHPSPWRPQASQRQRPAWKPSGTTTLYTPGLTTIASATGTGCPATGATR